MPRNEHFLRGITETGPNLFRGIFSERNSVPNPTQDVPSYSVHDIASLQYLRWTCVAICTYLYDTVSYKPGAKDGHYIIYPLHTQAPFCTTSV
jgi:hypothetical protein